MEWLWFYLFCLRSDNMYVIYISYILTKSNRVRKFYGCIQLHSTSGDLLTSKGTNPLIFVEPKVSTKISSKYIVLHYFSILFDIQKGCLSLLLKILILINLSSPWQFPWKIIKDKIFMTFITQVEHTDYGILFVNHVINLFYGSFWFWDELLSIAFAS